MGREDGDVLRREWTWGTAFWMVMFDDCSIEEIPDGRYA